MNEQLKFNTFSFLSTFARSLIEIFISLYLFKMGCTLQNIVLFYFSVNLISIPLSYIFVKLGEKTKYSYVMIIGFIAFLILQVLLRNMFNTTCYILLLAFIYSVYNKGYWVARRFYITKVMPIKNNTGLFSIILVLSQIASIASGYIGSFILDRTDMVILTIISSILLFLSGIPLFKIKYDNTQTKIKLKENLKKYNRSNYLIFSFFELNNILTFIFPIYIALYINDSYSLVGNLNAIRNLAIIIFVLLYGKIINKNKNYLVLSTVLVILCAICKLNINNVYILIVYFVEGLIIKMQNQSVNKVYFENRNNMDLTHYNLIYQIVECFMRAIVMIPMLFINNIKIMIMIVISAMILLLTIYIFYSKTIKDTDYV